MTRSIRRRLLVGTGIGVGFAFVVSGLLVHVLARASLYRQFDAELDGEVRTLSGLVEQDGDSIETDLSRDTMHEHFEVWVAGPTGLYDEVIARSPKLGDRDLAKREESIVIAQRDVRGAVEYAIRVDDGTLPDGRVARQVTYRFAPRQDETTRPPRLVTLAIARSTEEVEDAVDRLDSVLITVGALATLMSIGVLAWMARFGLAPVRTLAASIAALREENLAARLDVAHTPHELVPVVERLNELLGRLDAAFAREREMTAEVAHELRTPLAGLRVTIEVALDRERTPERYRTTLADCLSICTQTERMVGMLLSLAKLDAGMVSPRRDGVELDELVREVLAPLTARIADRELHIETELPPVTTTTDREQLRVVMQNLLDNAVSYADRGGTIRVELATGPTLRVSNTGCTLTSDQAAHVFERFWRGDEARTAGTHAGLGLALCRKLLDLLGGTIAATSAAGQFVATVVLVPDSRPASAIIIPNAVS